MDEETGKLKTDDVTVNPMATPEGLPSPKLDPERVVGDGQGPHSALQVEEGSSMPHRLHFHSMRQRSYSPYLYSGCHISFLRCTGFLLQLKMKLLARGAFNFCL